MLDQRSDRSLPVLVVGVAGYRLALPLGQVTEVLRMVAVAELPGAPPVVAGVVDRRGELVAVLDVGRRFGQPPQPPRLDDRLVAVALGPTAVLVWVHTVEGLRTLEPASIEPLAGDLSANDELAGVARGPDGLLLVVDPEAFLARRELADLRVLLSAVEVDA